MLGDKDDYFPLCKPLIDNLESGKKIAVVSYTLLLEVIDTMRKKMPKRTDFSGGTREECDSKKPIVEQKIIDFIKKINEYSKARKILIIRPRETISEHQSIILKKLQNYFGYIRVMSVCSQCNEGFVPRDSKLECPKCNETFEPTQKYQYKGLGYVDLEHAYLAKYGKSSTFYTSDTSFKSLSNDPDFKSIKFAIIPHPSKIK